MKIIHLLTIIPVALSSASALPNPPRPANLFYLRVNASSEPFHNRNITELPSFRILGLENFTVHSSTTPVLFTPVKQLSGNYALRRVYYGDDLSHTPYIAALTPLNGTTSTFMKVIDLPDPTDDALRMNPDACPSGYQCKADRWRVEEDMQGQPTRLTVAGSAGFWELGEDARPEGWVVYWKVGRSSRANVDCSAALQHSIQLSILPYKGYY